MFFLASTPIYCGSYWSARNTTVGREIQFEQYTVLYVRSYKRDCVGSHTQFSANDTGWTRKYSLNLKSPHFDEQMCKGM